MNSCSHYYSKIIPYLKLHCQYSTSFFDLRPNLCVWFFFSHNGKSKASEWVTDNAPVVSALTLDCNSAHKEWVEKTLRENCKLPRCHHPLVKNEGATRCVRKSALMRACLHTCVYELTWLCILSLREPGVITRWKCPQGCRFNVWLRATSPRFIVLFFCLTEEKTAVVSVYVD